jgi:ABC-type polysaccharide/polyol phosphate export permease
MLHAMSKHKGSHPLLNSWRIQRRVIAALFMREILTRYGRHNIGFLWLFIEPMIFTLGVTALWTLSGSHHGSNLPIIAFAITGYSSVLLWRNMPARCICAIAPNLGLMYHRNVKVIDLFVARLALEAVGATASFMLLSSLFITLGLFNPPENILMVVAGWLLLAWFGASLAILLGAWSEQTEIIEKIWHPASYLVFPLSGAAFLVDALPAQAQEIILLLPMVHGVEMVRDGFFGSAFRAHYDVTYLVFINIALSWLGLAKLSKVAQGVMPE